MKRVIQRSIFNKRLVSTIIIMVFALMENESKAHGGDQHDLPPESQITTRIDFEGEKPHGIFNYSRFRLNLSATDTQLLRAPSDPDKKLSDEFVEHHNDSVLEGSLSYLLSSTKSINFISGASRLTGALDSSIGFSHSLQSEMGKFLNRLYMTFPTSRESKELNKTITLNASSGFYFWVAKWNFGIVGTLSLPFYSNSAEASDVERSASELDHESSGHHEEDSHVAEAGRVGATFQSSRFIFARSFRIDSSYLVMMSSLRNSKSQLYETELTVARAVYLDEGWDVGLSFGLAHESNQLRFPEVPVSRLNLNVWM